MIRTCVVLLVSCVCGVCARAQIIYEPIRYQYGGQTPFYYGGNDPDAFRFADREYAHSHDGFFAARGNVMTHHEVSELRPHVYVDQLERANAALYGYTADDARNDAYNNAPRYFRKQDLLSHATREVDGAWRVPAQWPSTMISGAISIKPYVRPAAAPSRVIVIPKDLLDRKIEAPARMARTD